MGIRRLVDGPFPVVVITRATAQGCPWSFIFKLIRLPLGQFGLLSYDDYARVALDPTKPTGRQPDMCDREYQEPVLSRRRLLLTGAAFGAAALAACERPGAGRIADAPSPPAATDAEVSVTHTAGVMAQQLRDEKPAFSDVSSVTPMDGLQFLAGKQSRYPKATPASMGNFSASNIIEACDTDLLDQIAARGGQAQLSEVYRLIATATLDSLLEVHGSTPVLLALDAGHGGLRGVYFDPGSGSAGSEWLHARKVAGWIEGLVQVQPRYQSITIRRVYNDEIGDTFNMGRPHERTSSTSLAMRVVRASVLAYELREWNERHADRPIVEHAVSIHFNAETYATLMIHQGKDANPVFYDQSERFARAALARVRGSLNDSGILPYKLGLAVNSGLSDDRVLYPGVDLPDNPINPLTGVNRKNLPDRYALLQMSPFSQDYVNGALRFYKLV